MRKWNFESDLRKRSTQRLHDDYRNAVNAGNYRRAEQVSKALDTRSMIPVQSGIKYTVGDPENRDD